MQISASAASHANNAHRSMSPHTHLKGLRDTHTSAAVCSFIHLCTFRCETCLKSSSHRCRSDINRELQILLSVNKLFMWFVCCELWRNSSKKERLQTSSTRTGPAHQGSCCWTRLMITVAAEAPPGKSPRKNVLTQASGPSLLRPSGRVQLKPTMEKNYKCTHQVKTDTQGPRGQKVVPENFKFQFIARRICLRRTPPAPA